MITRRHDFCVREARLDVGANGAAWPERGFSCSMRLAGSRYASPVTLVFAPSVRSTVASGAPIAVACPKSPRDEASDTLKSP